MSGSNPTRTTLEKARALIADEKAWCRGWGNGKHRCAVHAVYDACGRATGTDYYRAIQALREQINMRSLSLFNDNSKHGDVLAMFDRAIAGANPS